MKIWCFVRPFLCMKMVKIFPQINISDKKNMSELLSRWLLIFAAVATRFMLRPFTMFLSLFQNPAELSFREEVNIFCDSCCGQLHQRRCNNSLYLGHLFYCCKNFSIRLEHCANLFAKYFYEVFMLYYYN